MAEILTKCSNCGGDGIEWRGTPGGGNTCGYCGGTGTMSAGSIAKLDEIKPTNTYYTYEIVEATDDTEYTALTSAQKTTYHLITSLGMVDLSEGTAIRSKLWTMFGEGTTTRANLETLIE